MSVQDYRINAEVRRYLVSRWVDVEGLQLGTTNGVVYIMGRLDTTLDDPSRRAEGKERRAPSERLLMLAASLDREIRRVRDVRDVVFRMDNVFKRGGRWRALDCRIGVRDGVQRAVTGRTAGWREDTSSDGPEQVQRWEIPSAGPADGSEAENEA